ncbi:MAG: hypothetical protein ABSF22_21510 [Bryobacteraceae bacterium]|jgi:hypothetical protein
MIRFTLTAVLTIGVLMLLGSPRMGARPKDTKIVVGDLGSIVIQADGLDDGSNFTLSSTEIRHKNTGGTLSSVDIAEASASKCGGSATCGIDASKAWKIDVVYGAGSLSISSISSNKGVHLKQHKLAFDQWKKTGNTDERVYGHGDGNKITSVKVNGGANLCAAKGCLITLLFTPQ